MFGPKVKPDINVEAIAANLKRGYYQPVLCEGCGMKMVVKRDDGQVEVAMDPVDPDQEEFDVMSLEDYLKSEKTIRS